ncbi:hypothetical protein Aple_099970 [Acrocarpospora pleiomorpha]|uniref:Uncharacterized protein n=1 Tax=Acrocarpospora pleiomorpha TaxID=90975 RepID=A0A5M3Y6G9_9ACTN|nr:hypothetical protein Aple_099970 [Acrocarpospora pleiomorpha]
MCDRLRGSACIAGGVYREAIWAADALRGIWLARAGHDLASPGGKDEPTVLADEQEQGAL